MDYAFYISYGICFGFFFGHAIWQLRKLRASVDELTKNIEKVESDLNALTTRLRIKNGNGNS